MDTGLIVISIPLILLVLTISFLLISAYMKVPKDKGHSFELVSELLIKIIEIIWPFRKK